MNFKKFFRSLIEHLKAKTSNLLLTEARKTASQKGTYKVHMKNYFWNRMQAQ